MNLTELARDIHQNAVDHGFWEDRSEHAWHRQLALILCELAEAVEEERRERPLVYVSEGKPEGVAVELADCVIRIMDYLVGIEKEDLLGILDLSTQTPMNYAGMTVSKLLLRSAMNISQYITLGLGGHLIDIVYDIAGWLTAHGENLFAVIQQKNDYNKTRPYKHGKAF